MAENKNIPEASPAELSKERSIYLRGTLTDSLNDELTGSLRSDDQYIIKFHGTYQQQDRDLDEERKLQKLEPLYSFLIRIRIPGGIISPGQWIEIDRIATELGDNTLKLTTRQAFELHGVFKRNLKESIKQINDTLLDTLAACGDVNRNVMSSANPFESPVHFEVGEAAKQISAHLTPQTQAYHEIWLDGKKITGTPDEEPLYGKYYLPRKFKIAIAIPPRNDVDVFANDLGFIAITENNKLIGYNAVAGGGMGMTFGANNTYPRVATVLGYLPKDKIVDVSEKLLILQRDNGNRNDRRNARLKYTIDRLGIDWISKELNRLLGWDLEPARPYLLETTGDKFGWFQSNDGLWHFTLFVEGGKVTDKDNYLLKTALTEIAAVHKGTFILTGNQNLVIASVNEAQKGIIEELFSKYGVKQAEKYTALHLHSIACVALPLCGLAFADAERYLPTLMDKIDVHLRRLNLENNPIVIRMTGCPNGCGRPFLAEIGLVGKAPGKYNLYLGAAFAGDRLNKLYREMLSETEILAILVPLLEDYARNRVHNERFGDFVIRKEYIKPTINGLDFHDNIKQAKKSDFQI